MTRAFLHLRGHLGHQDMQCNKDYKSPVGKKVWSSHTVSAESPDHQNCSSCMDRANKVNKSEEEFREDGYLYIAACSLWLYDNIFGLGFIWI